MSGIGPVNAFALAGSEAARKEKLTAPKKRSQTAVAVENTQSDSFDDVTTSELLQLARDAISGDHSLRPELMEAIQARMSGGMYEDKELLEKVAERLLLLLHEDSHN